MTPKVVRGTSFKGVGAYLLHDKAANTNDRVQFTETVNLPTDNANSAIAHMIDTATHANLLKEDAGVSLRGQKQKRPVYHYSLAWHPSEKVTMAVQMDAARESLKALDLDDRQALIVGHNDSKHPHVHVVVNLVSSENGKFPKLSNDYLKFSEWALEYEKKRGVVFCKEREKNQAKREFEYVKSDCLTRQEWMAWKKGQTAEVWQEYRKDRDDAREGRKGQYDALWEQKESRFAERKAEIKQVFKPMWRGLFQAQRQELKEFDTSLVSRLKFGLRQSADGKVKAIFQAMIKDQGLRQELIRYQEQQRLGLAGRQKSRIADASREITKAWKYDRDTLRDLHKGQDKDRLDKARSTTDAMWKDKTQPTQQEIAAMRTKGSAQRGFDEKSDRRKTEDKAVRETLDTFYGDDKEAMKEGKERNRQRIEKKGKTRKRHRPRNRSGRGGRTMD